MFDNSDIFSSSNALGNSESDTWIMHMNDLLSHEPLFEIGDKVTDSIDGEGIVVNIVRYTVYPVTVYFFESHKKIDFTWNGYRYSNIQDGDCLQKVSLPL